MTAQRLWLELDFLLDIHKKQIHAHGGALGIKDMGLIESAMGRPRNRAAYGAPDLAELAAAYAFGLCKNHGFNDGNKRAGWMAARVFLAMNRHVLLSTEQEGIDLMLNLAGGSLSEDELAVWFRERIKPL